MKKRQPNLIAAAALIEQGFAKAETVERLLTEPDAAPLNRYLAECARARNMAEIADSDAALAQHTAEMAAWCRSAGFAEGLVGLLWQQSGGDAEKTKTALREYAGFIQDHNLKSDVNEAFRRIARAK